MKRIKGSWRQSYVKAFNTSDSDDFTNCFLRVARDVHEPN